MTCCFFGHHDAPGSIRDTLEQTVRALIEDGSADYFLVGNHGSFDTMALSVLRTLKAKYPHIGYSVVLAYLPIAPQACSFVRPSETLFPDGLETVPKRFAISRRNDWMLSHSDIVVGYGQHLGHASQWVGKAVRQNKRVINLALKSVGRTE